MNSRAKLLTRIFEQGFRTPDWRHKQPPPVVTLEEFFEDNPQPQSIAANLDNHPGLAFFYERLKEIRAREDVQDVLVNIYSLADIIFNTPDGWPSAENVHILTSAPGELVEEWATELQSDGAGEGWPYGKSPFAPEPQPGFTWWVLTWD